MAWEIVVGIETHAQLATRSKMFSGAATDFGAPPNTQACAVDIALPGVLPVPNRAVLDVKLSPAPQLGAGQWRVDARVANFSDEPVKRLPVHLEVDGKAQVRGFLDLGPGEEGTKTFFTRIDTKEATPAAVVVEGDALGADANAAAACAGPVSVLQALQMMVTVISRTIRLPMSCTSACPAVGLEPAPGVRADPGRVGDTGA